MSENQDGEQILIRPKPLAELLDVSTQTIWRWAKMEGFPQPIKKGRIVLYDQKAVIKWLGQPDSEEQTL